MVISDPDKSSATCITNVTGTDREGGTLDIATAILARPVYSSSGGASRARTRHSACWRNQSQNAIERDPAVLFPLRHDRGDLSSINFIGDGGRDASTPADAGKRR